MLVWLTRGYCAARPQQMLARLGRLHCSPGGGDFAGLARAAASRPTRRNKEKRGRGFEPGEPGATVAASQRNRARASFEVGSFEAFVETLTQAFLLSTQFAKPLRGST